MPDEIPNWLHLNARERDVLNLVAEGLTDVEIGLRLNISPKTVNYRIETLKRRFNVKTRIQVVVIALRRRLID